MDESICGFDPGHVIWFRVMLCTYFMDELGMTIIYVMHSVFEMCDFCLCLVFLSKGCIVVDDYFDAV